MSKLRWLPRSPAILAVLSALLLALPLNGAHGSAAPDACIADVSPTLPGQPRSVGCEGGSIDFSISVPTQCPAGGCGMIIDGPGFRVSAEQVNENTGLRERARAKQRT